MTLKRIIKSFSLNSLRNKSDQTSNHSPLFLRNKYDRNPERRHPLCIGCSGGGGHNTAITAIIQQAKREGCLISNHPALKEICKNPKGLQSHKIAWGIFLLSNGPTAQITKVTSLPHLPTQEEIVEEIHLLLEQQGSFPFIEGEPCREYIDLMLDAYPTGYTNAAIWNRLQRKDRADDLKKLSAFQPASDHENYTFIKDYIFDELEKAELGINNKVPYTEVISSQAMSIPALCDAVAEFNKKYNRHIIIKEYLTDIATKGAKHFFTALTHLNSTQRELIELYAVGLADFLKHEPELYGFAKYIDIPPHENPMVREAFHDTEKLKSIDSNQGMDIHIKEGLGFKKIYVEPKENLGAVMLGSQTSEDTLAYVCDLLKICDKIFIFGGKKKEISAALDAMLQEFPVTQRMKLDAKLIRLDVQDDPQIAPIMRRSQNIVIRRGGLSAMEQMAVHENISKEVARTKRIYIHYTETDDVELHSGVEWEDENAHKLIQFLSARGIHAYKTSPSRFKEHIKGESCLKEEFIHQLNRYIIERLSKDKSRGIISKDTVINFIPLLNSHACTTKVSAANKLKNAILGTDETFAENEIMALEKGVLHSILKHYEKLFLLPPSYTRARKRYYQSTSLKM